MVEAVGIAASILGIIQITTKVASLSYSYISSVNRAPDELRRLAEELKSLTAVLTTLNICAKDHGPALVQLQGPLQNCASDLLRIQCKLENNAKAKASWLGISFTRLQWPFEEQETLNYVLQIERFKSLATMAMSADQVKRSKTIERGVQEINAIISQDEKLRIERKRMDVLNWLYPDDFDKRHIEISTRRQKDTGKWLLREPLVQEWCGGDPQNRLLWGYGIPGAGKTFLSSLLIDYLQDKATKAGCGVAYIYFNYKEQDQQDPRAFLASIVKQLGCQLERLPGNIEGLHQSLEKKHGRPAVEDLSAILFELRKPFISTFIICDALDECDPEKQRRTLLPLFHEMAKHGINVFLTSREYPEDIQISLQGSASAKIRFWAKEDDIRFYIKQKIADNPRARRLVEQGNCQDKIILQLQKCANGMFLLVHFHIKYLCQQATVKQILDELSRLESSSREEYPMDPTYNKALEAIRAQPRGCAELAFKVLTWLVRARRVLTVRELQLAVSIPSDEHCTTLDNFDLPDRSTLLDVCASLVMVDEEEDTVRLVHYTVQEYLLSNAIVSSDAETSYMITASCITFLSLDVFLQGACTSDRSLQDRRKLYPFLDYAAKQLSFHLRECDESLTTRSLLAFLDRKGNLSSYVQSYYVEKESKSSHDYYPKQHQALHVAVFLGHESATQLLLEKGADISSTNSYELNAFHIAAEAGHKPMVRLLLENGADVSSVDCYGQHALHYAARAGHESMVQLLLDNGADISSTDDRGQNALHMAALGRSEPMVQLLLDNGADISSTDDRGQNALHMAALWGSEPVVRLLLDNGADISSTNSDGQNALHMVVQGRSEPVVQLLLDNGADISSTDNRGRNALHMAARRGSEPVVQLLLDNGADISSTDSNGQNALHMAAQEGSEPVARLLLDNGTDISSVDIYGQNVLHMAALWGSEPVVQLLLDNGADISSTDSNGQSALHMAALRGSEPKVRLLLDNGADISAIADEGTAAMLADKYGHRQIAQLLREKNDQQEASQT